MSEYSGYCLMSRARQPVRLAVCDAPGQEGCLDLIRDGLAGIRPGLPPERQRRAKTCLADWAARIVKKTIWLHSLRQPEERGAEEKQKNKSELPASPGGRARYVGKNRRRAVGTESVRDVREEAKWARA